ncbi:hypothetical protein L210DRAFT_3504473 [Boletus edulis BED1]|uniref:Uncharacterized protein n=1 Tax=Boletus edulis BED1 TaxID=1328754 RepID=A0AAD4BTP5_BOLED|nr:hypothetical protein L210DRAFT_3504473 [Boletus edulis BED1]
MRGVGYDPKRPPRPLARTNPYPRSRGSRSPRSPNPSRYSVVARSQSPSSEAGTSDPPSPPHSERSSTSPASPQASMFDLESGDLGSRPASVAGLLPVSENLLKHSVPATTFSDMRLERWIRGSTFQMLQIKLRKMKADASDVEPFYKAHALQLRTIREPALNRAWAEKAQAIAGAVLDAVQAEATAANQQLEKTKMVLDFISSRVESLGQQVDAARKNKEMMDVLCDHQSAEAGQLAAFYLSLPTHSTSNLHGPGQAIPFSLTDDKKEDFKLETYVVRVWVLPAVAATAVGSIPNSSQLQVAATTVTGRDLKRQDATQFDFKAGRLSLEGTEATQEHTQSLKPRRAQSGGWQ